MNPGKTNIRNLIGMRTSELDAEMHLFLTKKKVPEDKINEYRKLRYLVQENFDPSEYRFNPFFAELITERLSQTMSHVGGLDLSGVLAHLFKRILVTSLVTILLLLVYCFISHGNLTEFPLIKPEELNEFKFISSILNQ